MVFETVGIEVVLSSDDSESLLLMLLLLSQKTGKEEGDSLLKLRMLNLQECRRNRVSII